MSSTLENARTILSIAKDIQHIVGVAKITNSPAADLLLSTPPVIPSFLCPEPLTDRLIELGLSQTIARQMSDVYMRNAEEFKKQAEKILATTYTRLAYIPRSNGTPKEEVHTKFYEALHSRYKTTLERLAQETIDLAHSHLASTTNVSPQPPLSSHSATSTKKSKRRFKSEYLPLFEFAFEKDRFPSREDKKHLARISSMSYRQVCVWFQNRRCRQSSRRSQSHTATPPPPPPQTFEEMKARLSASAREALADPAMGGRLSLQASGAPPRGGEAATAVVRSPGPEGGEVVSRGSSVHAGRTDDGYNTDERDELENDEPGENTTTQDHPPRVSSPVPETSRASLDEPVTPPSNPLMPFRTPTANSVFPAPYSPSKLTRDPFIVEHQPWVRPPGSHKTTMARPPIEPTTEDILGGFEGMDVDEEETDDAHVEQPLPRRAPASRSASSSSSDTCWSSSGLSRSTSYSTIASSVLSSPYLSDGELLTPCETEYAASPCVQEEEGEEEGEGAAAGLSHLTGATRGKVWRMDLAADLKDDAATPSKWEQLLAAVSVADT